MSRGYWCFCQTEVDFSHKTAVDTNGFSRLPADKIIDKKGTGEFKSVTGGFLEEVCSLISLKNSDSHTVNTGDR